MNATTAAATKPRFGARFLTPVLIGPMLNPINTSVISVALVPIATALHIASGTTIWLVAVLYLTSAVFQPTMGTLSDLYGPKKIYLIGLAIAVLAGVLPLLSHTFGAAIAARVLLGIGTSAAYPTALALIRDRSTTLQVDTPPTILAGLSISSLVTTAIGPVLGGALIVLFGWEAVFAINVPLAGVTLLLGMFWLPADRTRPNPTGRSRIMEAVDFVGIALFAIVIASLLFFLLDLSIGNTWMIIVCAIALIALVVWERRRSRPFLDVRLLASNGALSRTYLRLFLTYLVVYLFVYALSQWLQSDVGLSAGTAGLLQLPTAIIAGLASFAVSRTKKVRLPLIVTSIVPIVAGIIFGILSSSSPLWLILIAAGLFGIPSGIGSVSNQAALYRQAPGDKIGNAGGLSRTATNLGAIVSSSVIGIIFGQRPTDAGMNLIGWIVFGVSILLTVLTLVDGGLRKADREAIPS